MNNLYEALELCLQGIEQGADIETVLSRYPDLADELRPILEASVNAKGMAVPAPSAEVVQRNRAKVLQHAAQLREAKARRSGRIWSVSLRRLVVTLAVALALFVSGTGLVRAASTTLPGDNLYPVKRTWEDVLLLFTFNLHEREALEIEHENERLHELRELFAVGRSAEVDFSGWVTAQIGNEWVVAGVPVVISPQTEVRDGPIAIGSAVRVRGWTQRDGTVIAERIRLLSSTDSLPDVEYEPEAEEQDNEGPNQQNEDNSSPGSGGESPAVEKTSTPEPEFEPKKQSFSGTVNSINNNIWIVNGITMDVSFAEIKGTPGVGATVKVEGYYDANGIFIVTKIEFINGGSASGSSSGSNDNDNTNDNGGSDDNEDDDNSGSNSNDDSDSDDNDNDSSGGGGDNSGSGGGDGDDDE